MSENMDNLPNERQEQLKQIIKELHDGVPVEKLQKRFREIIKDTSPDEIANMENALIGEGFPPEEIQRLCDVHAQVFEKALSKVGKPSKIPGHPIYTFLQENKEAIRIMKSLLKTSKKFKKSDPKDTEISKFEKDFSALKEIEKHYVRKENQLFPALEAKKFTGPTKVMWGKHDEIRNLFKNTESMLRDKEWEGVLKQLKSLVSAIKKMIFLEEKILYPTAAKKLSTMDWAQIKKGEGDIGYAWVTPSNLWDASLAETIDKEQKILEPVSVPAESEAEKVKLEEGLLSVEQLTLMLKKLPMDITFVDENDKVRFYSANEERIFPRSPAVIGREVQNCHPHKSVHVVDDILKSFRQKEKDVAEFWIQKNSQFIYIQYFPVYNSNGEYKGVVEASQEVSRIRALKGERRILEW